MSTAEVRVWFNRHFSTIGRVLHLLRAAPDRLPIWACVSHRHEHFSGYAFSDCSFLEPGGLDAQAYLEWCLDTVQRYGISHIVPGHEQSFLTAHAREFHDSGCLVVGAAPPDILPNLHRKNWVYEQVADVVPLPRYATVFSVDQALAEIDRFRVDGDVCVKPCVSVYGKGFFRLVEGVPQRQDSDTVNGWEARVRESGHFKPHLVMHFLPGAEYSVDIAARDGELLAAVVRRKDELNKVQTIVEKPELVAFSKTMVRGFQLNGLINVQYKDDISGVARLLEINPRASGGIGMSCVSGVNLPDLAYRAILFPEKTINVAPPRTGFRVTEISLAVELPCPVPLP